METLEENILDVSVIEPKFKHPTIFVRFDELSGGESLVLHNDHDPKPLYYELKAERGEIFEWEYLEEGPETWKVRITKNESSQQKNEAILNATILDPNVKHATIFEHFDALKPGECFILHNDHDPRPLYYQLISQRGETFAWEYMEEGPDVWEIKITKSKNEHKDDENILNVSILEPRLKHPTVFARFDALKPGESFTLHNDHDPRPLYYQIMDQRGDIFTWEYLEQGPYLFRIKITKNDEEKNEEMHVKNTGAVKENILNVTAIEPKLKHPTIFVRFDELVSGENLIIHNDHDPKPLYYQLLGERGNIFTWEYLEQGPQLWRVKITKKLSGENDETLGEIAVKDLRKAEIFKKYGLDFCCGGKKTVKEACAEKGLDVTKVEQELQAADKATPPSASRPLPYSDWSLDFLADYIVNTHHSYVKKTIPDLRAYSSKVAKVHGDKHPELEAINKLVQEVCDEMSEHMVKEEEIVFPFVKQVAAKNNGSTFGEFDNLKAPIDMMEMEHDFVGRSMEQIRRVSNNYTLPADGCASYSFLFKTLEEFESDLFIHIHLENNILFPKALALEKK